MTMSESLVTRLMNPFLHNGHIPYTDSYQWQCDQRKFFILQKVAC